MIPAKHKRINEDRTDVIYYAIENMIWPANRFQIHLTVCVLFIFLVFCKVPAAVAQQYDAPVEAQIPHRPTVFEGSDRRLHLAYEIHLTNFYSSTGVLIIKSLSVFGETSASPIATFSKEDLTGLLNADEMPEKGTDLIIPPGKRKVLFIWLTLPQGTPAPKKLHHIIKFADTSNKIHALNGLITYSDQKRVLMLGPPVQGNIWLVDEGPGDSKSHHWGSMLAQNGLVTIPQRFAIDFIGLNNIAHAVETSPDKLNQTSNNQWIGFGSRILAVHDAIVRDVRDGIPDHKPLSPLPEPDELTVRGLYGNFIVLEIAPGIFAHYAHLQNGSIRVHTGEHVKLGDVLARLGDSGNAGGPHLHFHVSDKSTFELSEGVPFVFSKIDLLGKTDEGRMFNTASRFPVKLSIERNVLPLNGDVVRF